MSAEEIRKLDDEGYRFRVDGWSGIAFYFYAEETEPDEDTVWSGYENPTGNVLMVMVGDDRKHVIDPDDVFTIEEDEYCPECGQIGCKAYAL